MANTLLSRKSSHFVLWRPHQISPAPQLIIGRFQAGDPATLADEQRFDLQPSPLGPELWEIAASDCGLVDGQIYHYWFELLDSNPSNPTPQRIRCTDPTAWNVDWRLLAPALPPPYGDSDRDPAGVLRYQDGQLVACDPDGATADWGGDTTLDQLPPNNRLVIYELPASWARIDEIGGVGISGGSFRDVAALISDEAAAPGFIGVAALAQGRAHLVELGVNALELLPPADSFVDRAWGYATSNYFAADYTLGFPHGSTSPMPSHDLAALVRCCHTHGMRFFDDMVMAFATRYSYQNINFSDFHVQYGSGDPEEYTGNGHHRDGFGGDLFKYNFWTEGYDPIDGQTHWLVPARRLMLMYLERWMRDFRIDGARLDSIENIGSWDFVQDFRNHARAIWQQRWQEQGLGAGADERFLVVGEELSVPLGLVEQQRLDGLWNENFKRMLRYALLGQSAPSEPSFAETLRKIIDCRLLGFSDGTQAINYVTSHDVGGYRNERLYNFLNANGVWETDRRIKLAFVCLLTAVGVPMILAGEEFADQHDLSTDSSQKQIDPVNYDRVDEPWRHAVFEHVARLVRLRTRSHALAVNDTAFIHADFNDGKQVLAWLRGQPGSDEQVVVIANFSGWGSPGDPGAEYRVTAFPAAPAGRRWREITQDRVVPPEWAGREPLFPWEAKVYALEPSV